ncbi:MAG: glucuronate isomerase [Oscillospiraceae bacterium]|nr:glucuronate isomerase [Oscillospiraceae bacterium]
MKKFMDENFLLQTPTAERLYATVKDLPIIDWHCHLDPREIAEAQKFSNLTELWLGGDHYKFRVMRACGVDEKYITGNAGDYEKFEKWAATIENCIGSPLYHWTHLELKRIFDCDINLSAKTAKQVWEHCSSILEKGMDVSQIIKKFNVEMICTSDNPLDSLEFHKKIKQSGFGAKVKPTFRPSDLLNIESPNWGEYIAKLSETTGININDYQSLKEAAYNRVEFFHANGCNMADHALDPPVFGEMQEEMFDVLIKQAKAGEIISEKRVAAYKSKIQTDLAEKYKEKGWSMQLHIGAARNVNTAMVELVGTDKGYDCMSDDVYADSLLRLLDSIEKNSGLPRTILFCLNPRDNDLLACIAGSFQGGGQKGKIQFGPGWWFNDHKDGMEKQMIALANNGVLSLFAGMLTDSRSFLSYTRHEYFRRILCNLIGNWVENGEYPADFDKLEEMVKNISYFNAKEYFG